MSALRVDITALVRGGTRKGEYQDHEVSLRLTDGVVVARVGFFDGSDWCDEFTRRQWVMFSERVLALFDAAESQASLTGAEDE